MTQAIITKRLGPTNTRGDRIKATSWGGSIIVPWDYAVSTEVNHDMCAKALASKMGWRGSWHSGSHPDGAGNVYVKSPHCPAFTL